MIQKRPDKPARRGSRGGGTNGGKTDTKSGGKTGGTSGRKAGGKRAKAGRTAAAEAAAGDGDGALATAAELEPAEAEAVVAQATGEPEPGSADEESTPDEAGDAAAADDDASAEASTDDGAEDAPKGRKRKPAAPKEPVDVDALSLRLEALLFASGQVLGVRRLAKALEVSGDDVHAGIERLAARWAERETALELVEVSGGWRLVTKAAWHEDVARLTAKAKTEKLSPAALETLAVVAYRQPIGRADIESVRGVQCGPLLRVLLDRDLIRIAGRSSEPGHPLLYGTTRRFLDHFGLASLKNLPDVKDLLNVS